MENDYDIDLQTITKVRTRTIGKKMGLQDKDGKISFIK